MKKKKTRKGLKIFRTLLIIVSIFFILSLFGLDILTISYLTIIALLIGIMDVIIFVLLKTKKKKKFGYIFGTVLISILSVATFYILKTNNILLSFNKNYKTYNYSVVVLNKSDYTKINDIQNKELGYYKTDGEECDKSLEELKNKVTTINKSYNNIDDLALSLLNNEIDSILIENSYLDILEENASRNQEIANFSDEIKIIYTFSVKINITDISKDVNVTKQPFSIYISGIDTYGTVASVSRSDVNMVITINPKTQQILLTSIPRDYYVTLHNITGYRDKITHAGLYGIDMSVQTIEDLLDIKINYYVKVNFTSIIDIVNTVGGVSVYSDYSFTSIDGYNYTEGYNLVNGEEALSFVRERKAFATGDKQRIKNQQALIKALFKKCTSKDIIVKYNSLLNSVSNSIVTNIPTDRLTSLIKMQLSKNYDWTITSNSLEGENASNYTYSTPTQKVYVMEPDEESVEEAKALIESIINGEVQENVGKEESSDIHNVTKNSNESTTNTEKKKETTTKEIITTGLEAKLIRKSFTFNEGEEFIYHGFTATYDNKDITNNVKVSFNVNGAIFDNYNDLISYVSSLSANTYIIVYTITYKEETATLKQTVIIESAVQEKIETDDIYNDELDENDVSSPSNDNLFDEVNE